MGVCFQHDANAIESLKFSFVEVIYPGKHVIFSRGLHFGDKSMIGDPAGLPYWRESTLRFLERMPVTHGCQRAN